MPPRESPPGGEARRRALHFGYVPTAANEQWHAFIAGKPRWLYCHCKGKTKPCVHAITGGELHCELCNPMNPAESTGFLPLWREIDWKPVFVIVHEPVREAVSGFSHRARVLIGRGGGSTDGVYVISPLKKGSYLSSTDPQKMAEQDVFPSLVRIWKHPGLIEWHARDTGRETGGCITPPEKPDVLPITPRITMPVDSDHDTAGINDAFVRAVRRGSLSNGKHDPLPPDDPPGEGV